MESQEQRDGRTLKNNVMGCQAELRDSKKLLQSAVATGHNRPRPRPKILSTTSCTQCNVERRQDGLLSSDTCFSSFGVRLFVLVPPVHLVSRFPSLCCTESEDSIDGEFNSENSFVLSISAFRFLFSSRPDVLHTVI